MSTAAPWALRGRRPLGVRVLGFSVGVGLVAALALPVLLLSRPSSPPGVELVRPVTVSARDFSARTGVRVVQIAVTGGGGLLDLRYQVVDPDKAGALHDPETPPGLIDEATGTPVSQLVMNHAHKGPVKAGVTYYLVFYNPGDVVHRGSRATVQLGGARLKHVRVR